MGAREALVILLELQVEAQVNPLLKWRKAGRERLPFADDSECEWVCDTEPPQRVQHS